MILLWLGSCLARPVPLIRLSEVRNPFRIDEIAQVQVWENGSPGRPQQKREALECCICFRIENDTGTDTTYYLGAATNSWIVLELKDTAGRPVSRQQTGYNVPVQQQFSHDGAYILPLRLAAGQKVNALLYFKGYFGAAARTEAYLYNREGYLQYLHDETAAGHTQEFIVVFFTGAMLMLLLFFLFMYAKSNQVLYGRYAAYLGLQWVYGMLKLGSATLVGYALLHFPFIRFALVEPVVMAAVGCYVWFVNELLDLKRQYPKLCRILKGLAYVLWGYSLVFGLLSFALPDMPFRLAVWSGMRLLLLVTNIPLLVYIGLQVKSSVKHYYLIGNTLFILFSLVAGLYWRIPLLADGYLSRLNTTTWYMTGILLECIFFAFALGIRMKELQKTKQQSDKMLIEQMQVNEKLILETNQQLEQKVEERTEEIRRQARQLEEVRLQETRAAYERQLSETRMEALRSRMNPHFIFNSLNSIKYFILKKENDTAEFYLNKFGRLLRLILDYTTHETITLQQELEALNVYLEIESVRFDKSFHYHIQVDERVNTERVNIPPLLLQPFVENAIWHGLANSDKSEKFCQIEVTRLRRQVLIRIIDNGVGREAARQINAYKPNRHISHGLKITEDRITLFNNMGNGLLNITVQDNEDDQQEPAGTTVNITIENPEV